MERQKLDLALILFVVSISIASVASIAPKASITLVAKISPKASVAPKVSIAPAASPNVVESPVDNSVIGTLDGIVGGAAPVGGPVPEGVFGNLSPESQSSGASVNSGVSTIAFAVTISSIVACFFLL